MKKFLFLALMTLSLSACGERNEDYYLLHPDALFKAETQCQSLRGQGTSSECKMIESTAQTFRTLLQEEETDPQQFGLRILNAQIQCLTARNAVIEARQAIATLKPDAISADALTAAKTKLADSEAKYEADKREVKNLLAVIALHSPD